MTKLADYVRDTYSAQERREIITNGCGSGCAGELIYYTDTVAFHDEYENDIWDKLYKESETQGMNILEMISCFNGAKDVGSMTQLKNLLTWYAVEDECALQTEDF